MNETNSLDMMQNSSIIYHTESVLEMQIACLIFCLILNEMWSGTQGYGKGSDVYENNYIDLGLKVR